MSFEVLGLDDDAFATTCDDRYAFASEPFRRTCAELVRLAEAGRSPIVLTGATGIGKTTFIRYLSSNLIENGWSCEIRRAGEAWRAVSSNPARSDLMAPAVPQAGKRAGPSSRREAVLVDDAHDLPDHAFDDIFGAPSARNSNSGSRPFVVLIGTSAVIHRLSENKPQPVVAAYLRLLPLRHEDVNSYIRHRLMIAGNAGQDLFSKAAIDLMAAYSRGVCGEINRLADASLQLAEVEGRLLVDVDIIHQAAFDIGLVDNAPNVAPIPLPALLGRAGAPAALTYSGSGLPAVADGITASSSPSRPKAGRQFIAIGVGCVAIAVLIWLLPAADTVGRGSGGHTPAVVAQGAEEAAIRPASATAAPSIEEVAVASGTAAASGSGSATSTSAPDQVDTSIARGDKLLDLGDYAGARLFYALALRQGSPEAAVKLAETYDPRLLPRARVQGLRADPQQAAAYYGMAEQLRNRSSKD